MNINKNKLEKETTYSQLCHLSTNDVILIKNSAIQVLKNRGFDSDSLIPRKIKIKEHISSNTNFAEFQEIFDEDWSDCFKKDYDLNRVYYVYYHTNPFKPDLIFGNSKTGLVFKGFPFYIGKGCGKRLLNEKRYLNHSIYLKRILSMGTDMETVSNVIFDNLTEKEALILESKLITFLGTKNTVFENEKWLHGRRGAFLINTIIPNRPKKYNNLYGNEK
jgi:hypothetical protein